MNFNLVLFPPEHQPKTEMGVTKDFLQHMKNISVACWKPTQLKSVANIPWDIAGECECHERV